MISAAVPKAFAQSSTFRIWIAGDYNAALAATREYCASVGSCFAVAPAAYVYTGGLEDGVCVTLIHYPRFPSTCEDLRDRAVSLAHHLRQRLHQSSFSVEGPDFTEWWSFRPEDAEK